VERDPGRVLPELRRPPRGAGHGQP